MEKPSTLAWALPGEMVEETNTDNAISPER